MLDYVRDGEQIATLPDAMMESLLEIADDEHVIPTPEKISTRFQNGDRVKIRGVSQPSLAGCPAVYDHAIDETRAIVLVDWCGRMCPAAIDERELEREAEKIEAAPRRNRRRRRGRNRTRVHRTPE
jgi:predicted ATP-grasp superfamily ATP-dependent carboligase